jgi:Zn-finger nucleic acid-binding protein
MESIQAIKLEYWNYSSVRFLLMEDDEICMCMLCRGKWRHEGLLEKYTAHNNAREGIVAEHCSTAVLFNRIEACLHDSKQYLAKKIN